MISGFRSSCIQERISGNLIFMFTYLFRWLVKVIQQNSGSRITWVFWIINWKLAFTKWKILNAKIWWHDFITEYSIVQGIIFNVKALKLVQIQLLGNKKKNNYQVDLREGY